MKCCCCYCYLSSQSLLGDALCVNFIMGFDIGLCIRLGSCVASYCVMMQAHAAMQLCIY